MTQPSFTWRGLLAITLSGLATFGIILGTNGYAGASEWTRVALSVLIPATNLAACLAIAVWRYGKALEDA